MSREQTPEWLPEELTKKGIGVAADPPPPERSEAALDGDGAGSADAGGNGASPRAAPVDQVERVVRDRVAEIERRIEARLAAVVADMKRTLDGGDARPPTPDPFAAAPAASTGSRRRGHPRMSRDEPRLDGEVESRLKEAERRVARAARATERNVDEVRRILGARLAASRWVSDGEGRRRD